MHVIKCIGISNVMPDYNPLTLPLTYVHVFIHFRSEPRVFEPSQSQDAFKNIKDLLIKPSSAPGTDTLLTYIGHGQGS